MVIRDQIGRDLIEETLNRVLKLYAGPLRNDNHPWHKNELLGPIVAKLADADSEAILELIDHSSVMLIHGLLNHLTRRDAEEGWAVRFTKFP